MTRTPVSTYRLQITSDFTLDDAADIVDYIHDLGADWIYLSPLLTAEAGSQHGYDVIEHSSVDPSRGGAAGLQRLADAAHALGMGVLVDIVPNHVGVATPHASRWWWDVLQHGRASQYAEAFDVDWEFTGGRLRLPVLGDEDEPELEVVEGELRYHEHRFPLADGSYEGMSPAQVHDRQHYELVNWRRADAELNYRRFFAVNSLAGIRVERPDVLAESHAEIRRWVAEGIVDGLRIDHPDGLADPGKYLDDLAELTGVKYVLVEKILEGDEQLPSSWAAAGTTGYDALGDLDRVLVDPVGAERLDAVDVELRGGADAPEWHDLIHDTKRAVADGMLHSEVLRLGRELGNASQGSTSEDAIAELLACFPVYRSYLPDGRDQFDLALTDARRRRPDLDEALDALTPILTDPTHPAAVRFQQTSGMVMAKGVEDCAFYRYNRLTSLTEVGAEPSQPAIDIAELHRRQQRRQASWPMSMTALTTHDTKRSEDTRMRIDALSEIADEWTEGLATLRELAPLADGALSELLWQAIVGAWPASRERLHAYAEKAAREAGNSTAWTAPDEQFEKQMHALVDAAFDDAAVTRVVERIVARVSGPARSNSLTAKLVQITAPGVPDVYQGTEWWDHSLVDPDNRRSVDYAARRSMLASMSAETAAVPAIDDSAAAKLLVTTRALRVRRDRPELFRRYTPISASGAAADHLIAFDRGGAITLGTRLSVSLADDGGWRDTTITLRRRPMVEIISGRSFEGGVQLVGDLLEQYPVALLVPA